LSTNPAELSQLEGREGLYSGSCPRRFRALAASGCATESAILPIRQTQLGLLELPTSRSIQTPNFSFGEAPNERNRETCYCTLERGASESNEAKGKIRSLKWQGRRDSNPQQADLESAALAIGATALKNLRRVSIGKRAALNQKRILLNNFSNNAGANCSATLAYCKAELCIHCDRNN
jgi:hypothetical protein